MRLEDDFSQEAPASQGEASTPSLLEEQDERDCSRRLDDERERKRAANKQKKEKRLDRLQNERTNKAQKDGAQLETIGVMFVDQTTGGILAKMLQEVEDRMARATGYRIRMVELSGSKLCHLLPNTNPWSGNDCGRVNCVLCSQGGEKRIECKRRNILYESECVMCNPEESKEKEVDLGKRHGVYVGESARSLHERSLEHVGDYKGRKEYSHI